MIIKFSDLDLIKSIRDIDLFDEVMVGANKILESEKPNISLFRYWISMTTKTKPERPNRECDRDYCKKHWLKLKRFATEWKKENL